MIINFFYHYKLERQKIIARENHTFEMSLMLHSYFMAITTTLPSPPTPRAESFSQLVFCVSSFSIYELSSFSARVFTALQLCYVQLFVHQIFRLTASRGQMLQKWKSSGICCHLNIKDFNFDEVQFIYFFFLLLFIFCCLKYKFIAKYKVIQNDQYSSSKTCINLALVVRSCLWKFWVTFCIWNDKHPHSFCVCVDIQFPIPLLKTQFFAH